MNSVLFGNHTDGYDYSYLSNRIPKYCGYCGIPVVWFPVGREEIWQKFDTETGKKYLYEVCLCPTDKKLRDKKLRDELKEIEKQSSLFEKLWRKVIETKFSLHVGMYSDTPYFRRCLQSNLEVMEEKG